MSIQTISAVRSPVRSRFRAGPEIVLAGSKPLKAPPSKRGTVEVSVARSANVRGRAEALAAHHGSAGAALTNALMRGMAALEREAGLSSPARIERLRHRSGEVAADE